MSQGAISSLVYSSGTVVTASANMSHIFGRPPISKKHRKSIQLSFSSATSYSSFTTETNVSQKSPLKRFKLFRSKNKRSKISSSTYIAHPPVIPDDDVSSICSESTSVFTIKDRDRRTLSTPNLPTALQQSQQYWNNSPNSPTFIPHSSVSEIVLEEEEEEEDWDTQSVGGYNNKAAGTSSPSLPIPIPNNSTSPKRHSRCRSLPPNIQDFSPSLYHRQPTPSEVWDEDEDFDLEDTNELNVPSSVEETQFSLRMDISNIRDFVTQIGELKDLRDKKEKLSSTIRSKMTRKWQKGFLRTSSKKVKKLENSYKRYWEEAIVIIDIADLNNETNFEGESRVEVDIEHIPSERHRKIFKKIIADGLGEDVKSLGLFDDDDDKENYNDYDSSSNSSNIFTKNKRLMSFCMNDDDDEDRIKRRRKENFRMSVEAMPSLIDYLKKLQTQLNDHVKELGQMAHDTI